MADPSNITDAQIQAFWDRGIRPTLGDLPEDAVNRLRGRYVADVRANPEALRQLAEEITEDRRAAVTATTPPLAHLEECGPEQHPAWVQMPYREALEQGAAMCEQTRYMTDELFPDEAVWVQSQRMGEDADA